jgi:hypothetical protein
MTLNWGAQLLRLTVFSSGAITITDADWQAITAQSESESRQNIPGGKRLSGTFEPGRLTVAAVGGRLDIVFTSLEKQEQLREPNLPIIGPLDEALKAFLGATLSWIEKAPYPINRVAFGATLLSKTETRKQAYEALKTFVKSLAVDPEEMRDLLYRVNWPVKSKVVPNLIINRLTTWSAPRILMRMIQIGDSQVAEPDPAEIQAVGLEIDHNTDEAHRQAFDQGQIGPIYRELVEFARENAVEGERP